MFRLRLNDVQKAIILCIVITWICFLGLQISIRQPTYSILPKETRTFDIATQEYPGQNWRYVENHPEFAINSNPTVSDPIYLPLRQPWGTVYKPHRILCFIPTIWPDRKWKMELIARTYAPDCTKLVWVIDAAANATSDSYAGHDILKLNLTRKQTATQTQLQKNIWEKIHRLWSTAYLNKDFLDNFEWFLKIDDDTFFAPNNLFGLIRYYDPNESHYLGRVMRHRWKLTNTLYNSGTCLVLSRGALQKLGPFIVNLPTVNEVQPTLLTRDYCVDRGGPLSDANTGVCLGGVGIRPENTLDHELRERFLLWEDERNEKKTTAAFDQDWFGLYTVPGSGKGDRCCSPHAISFHGYKDRIKSEDAFPKLNAKYNTPKDWDNMILPPRPRLLLWDRHAVGFEMDEYLNIKSPPAGQRIFKGPGKEWQCHKCRIGDWNDTFWTEWWDDKDRKYGRSRHFNDSYAPI